MADARIGTTVADYRIEAFLGRGGQGMVYLAEHITLGRKAALKLLPPDLATDREFRERFIREARLAASLDHPNILPVYDAGEENGELFLAQRLVKGMDLGLYLEREGRLSPERSIEVLAPIAGALDAAHRRGLVHRDVKPGNILIQLPTDDEAERVYLSDFGLTKDLVSEQDMSGTGRLTKAGYFVGTPHYSAPEQIQSEPLDGRTDEYSLACVLYQCLTGEVPFPRPSETAALVAHVVDPPPEPSDRVPGLPRGLDGVIARGMAKKKDDRYGSCRELVEAARAALTATPAAPARPDAPPPPPPGRPAQTPVQPDSGGAIAPPPAPTDSGPMPAPPRTLPPPVPPGPGTPPGPPGPRRRGMLVALIGGGVAVAALVVVLVLVLGGGDGGPGPSPTGPTVTNTTPAVAAIGADEFVVTRNEGGTDDVIVESTGGEVVRTLAADPAADFTPSLSRDRTKVVFTSRRDGGDDDIFVVNADGSGLRQLTSNDAGDTSPSFSPDGSQIVFQSDRDGDTDIYAMDANGNNVVQLTNDPARDEAPSFSPDGTQIAFVSNRVNGDADTDIFLMNADGSGQSFFAGGTDIEEFPAWSPDGRSIAFDSNRDGGFDIFIRDVADGSFDVKGPSSAKNDAFATWSPDGTQIAFSRIADDNTDADTLIGPATAGGTASPVQTAANERDPSWS